MRSSEICPQYSSGHGVSHDEHHAVAAAGKRVIQKILAVFLGIWLVENFSQVAGGFGVVCPRQNAGEVAAAVRAQQDVFSSQDRHCDGTPFVVRESIGKSVFFFGVNCVDFSFKLDILAASSGQSQTSSVSMPFGRAHLARHSAGVGGSSLGGASADAQSYWQGRFAACSFVDCVLEIERPRNSWGVAPNPTRDAVP